MMLLLPSEDCRLKEGSQQRLLLIAMCIMAMEMQRSSTVIPVSVSWISIRRIIFIQRQRFLQVIRFLYHLRTILMTNGIFLSSNRGLIGLWTSRNLISFFILQALTRTKVIV